MQKIDLRAAISLILFALLVCASFLVWKKSRVIEDYHYSQVWTFYYIHNRLEHGEYGEAEDALLRLAEASRRDLYQGLQTGLSEYPNHPSLGQLICLIVMDSETYGFTVPEWVREKAATLDAEKVMQKDRYLTKR